MNAHNRLILILLAAILLLGAFLRIHSLGVAVLWIDELTVVGQAGVEKTPVKIASEIMAGGFKGSTGQHMPFQYVWVNTFIHIYHALGITPSEFHYRLPFALLGIATIPLIFIAVRRAYNFRVGLWAAFLLALSFFHVYQSRDATSYAPLLFFLSVGWCGLVWMLKNPPATIRGVAMAALVIWLGTAGAIFSHLTAWFAVVAEGAALAALVVWHWRVKPGNTSERIHRSRYELMAAGAIALAGLPFLPMFLAGIKTTKPPVEGVIDTLTWPLIAFQFSAYGWGRGQGRLVFFCALLAAGVWLSLRNRQTRTVASVQLALVLLPAAFFFYALSRDFYPRYLAVLFVPFLVFAALGLEGLLALLKSKATRIGAASLVVLALAAWHVQPYSTLFHMQDKLMPMSKVKAWIEKNCPPGGLYVWRNGYHMREVPGIHPPRDVSHAFADYPTAGIPDEVYQWRANNARSIFVRFPEAVYITEPDYDRPHLWNWGLSDFTVKDWVANDDIDKFWKWGLSAHGFRVSEGPRFICCKNRPEDISRRLQQMGQPFAWPTGPGWKYVQSQEGVVLLTPAKEGALLSMYVPEGGAGTYDLHLRGVTLASGNISGWLVQNGQWTAPSRLTFEPSQNWMGQLGPFSLGTVPSALAVSRYPLDQLNVLVYEMSLRLNDRGS